MTKPQGSPGGGGSDPDGPSPSPQTRVRCRWCGRPIDARPGPGRPRTYCRQGCRQQAHTARKLAHSHGLGDGDVIVARDTLDQLQGALYCLQAAIEDVDRDLAEAPDDPDEAARALAWLLDNARPLASTWVEPRTVGP